MHVEALTNFLIALSCDDQIGCGLQQLGSISTINGLSGQRRQLENRFLHLCHDWYYLWLEKR